MASNINTNNIDETYPIAGQDNDSQGFRDNFQNIKTAIGVAKTEITSLQNGSPQLTADNNFNGNTISNAVFKDITQKVNNITLSGSNNTVDFSTGSYQRLALSQDTNEINFSNFGPNDTLSHMRLEVRNSAADRSRTFSINISGNPIYVNQSKIDDEGTALAFPFTVADNITDRYIFDVWGYQVSGGVPAAIFVEYVGKFATA